MGLFSRRAPQRQPQADESPIGALYPDFFCRALAAAGTAPTTENMDSAASTMAAEIALNARRWFVEFDDPAAASRFDAEFNAASRSAGSTATCLPDEMIAFLWSWTPRCHEPLRRVVKQTQGKILWLARPTCGSCGSGPLPQS